MRISNRRPRCRSNPEDVPSRSAHARPLIGALATLAAVGAGSFLAPRPAWAQDNSGFGLDLTDDNKKPDEKKTDQPQKPADATPPATPSDQPPAEGEAAKPVAKQGLDVGEHDVSLEDRVKSVQRKSFDKKNHFEIEPRFGVSMNDAFYQKYIPGAQAAFHFSDPLALAVRFDYDLVETTDDVTAAKRELHSTLFVSKPKFGTAADFMWTPAFGKASLFNSIIQFDTFVLAGAGAMITQTSSNSSNPNPLVNQGPHPAVDLGVGQRFALNDFMALEWQVVETLYNDTPGGQGEGQTQSIVTLNLGLAFFIPPIRSDLTTP